MANLFKKGWPYMLAVLIFIVLTVTYFNPVLSGKKLAQMDDIHARGMAKELVDHQAATGEKAMWTNSMFSGMPAYQIKGDSSASLFAYINKITRLGLPFQTMGILFLYMLGFYVLLLSLKVDKWLSLVGAVAFAFGSFNIIIIAVGHITQAYAIALMAPVVAAVLYAYNRNKWVGGLMLTVALGLEIAYNHPQITYYLALLVLVILGVRLFTAIKEKTTQEFGKITGVLALAAMLSVLPNLTSLWTTYEYGKASSRGASELKQADGSKTGSGLDKDYALAWSYGVKETLTLMIPNVVGGASEPLAGNQDVLSAVNATFREPVSQQSQYWGGRSFTSGPVYAGAIICFLFLLAAFIYKGPEKWWLIAGTLLSLFLAWGKNFPMFTDFMFDYFPLYNKFRTVEMALVIASLTMPVLAFLGLQQIIDRPEVIRQNGKWFVLSLLLTAGVSIVLYLMPGAFFDFISADELKAILDQKQQMVSQNPQYGVMFDQFIDNLKIARIELLKADALRSFFFIALASASIWFYAANKFSTNYLLGGLAILILVDMWSIDKRYLGNDDFKPAAEVQHFVETPADKAILADQDPYYRVFSIYRNPFNDAYTSYYHKSIGGYHGAKLRRYQDLIDAYLSTNWQQLGGMLQKGYIPEVDSALASMQVLNMLNAKYIVFNPSSNPVVNTSAMGNAWFVKSVAMVANANEELAALASTDLRVTAVVDQKFASEVQGYATDSVSGLLTLTKYAPDKLTFTSNTKQPQLAVFSDVYYDKGWNAYINGQPVKHIRANYVLRAMMVPAGENTIEFKFEPTSYSVGKMISALASVLILAMIAYWVYTEMKKRKQL